MSGRAQTPDLLKGIAVLLMIQVHIVELFATPAIANSIPGKLLLFLGGPFVAPVFIFFLGYFLMDSKKNNRQLFFRGVQLFFLGMVLNIVLNLNLILSVNRGLLNIDLWPYVFGVDVLQFAGLAVLVFVGLKRLLLKSSVLAIFLIVVTAFLGNYLLRFVPEANYLKYISAFLYGSVNWSYFPLFPWLAYLFSGIVFYLVLKQIDISKIQNGAIRMAAFILFLFFMASTIFYSVSVSSNLQSYYHHGILFASWTLVFLTFYGYMANETNKVIGDNGVVRLLKWFGKNVTTIYVLQWVIIGNIATEVYKTISSPIVLMLSFIGVVLTSGILCFIYQKMIRLGKRQTAN